MPMYTIMFSQYKAWALGGLYPVEVLHYTVSCGQYEHIIIMITHLVYPLTFQPCCQALP